MTTIQYNTPTSATATSALLFSAQPTAKAPAFLGNPVAYYSRFARIAGGAREGLFLSQLWYWTQKMLAKHGDRFDGWIWKDADEWEAETGLTRAEQKTARKHLEARGLLTTSKKGRVHGVLHFRLDTQVLFCLLAHIGDSSKAQAQKVKGSSPKSPKHFGENAKDITETTPETSQKLQQHAAPVVASSTPLIVKATPVEAIPDENAERLRQQVEAVGVKPHVARQLVEKYPRERVAAQLRWLDARNPRSPAAILVKSIHEDWDAPASASVKAPETPQIPAKAPESAQERADREKMALGRLQALQGAAQRAFEGLAPHSQNYARSDMASRAADGKDGSLLATMQSQFDSELHGELRKQKEVRH